MGNQAKRRFLGLKTGEVSLVDEGAVEEPFHVVKNKAQGEKDMTTAAAQATDNDDAARVPVEAEGGGEAVAKAPEHVQAIVSDIAKVVTSKSADA